MICCQSTIDTTTIERHSYYIVSAQCGLVCQSCEGEDIHMHSLWRKPSLRDNRKAKGALAPSVVIGVCAYYPMLTGLLGGVISRREGAALQGGGLGLPAAASITFLGGAAGGGTSSQDSAGGFGKICFFAQSGTQRICEACTALLSHGILPNYKQSGSTTNKYRQTKSHLVLETTCVAFSRSI